MLSRLALRPAINVLQCRQIATTLLKSARFESPRTGREAFQQFSKAFRVREGPTFKEKLLGPTTGKPFIYGTYALIGASAFGLGMLCYYGAGLSKDISALDRSTMWPQYVRDRLHSTYSYLAGGLALTAGSGYVVSRTPALLAITSSGSLLSFFGSLALIIGSGAIVRGIDYKSNSVAKHLAWMGHCSILGGVLAPMCMLGGPILVKAAWYTAGVVAGLSAIAMTAPSEKFLYMTGPLAMGLGVVLVANIGSFVFPPHTALGAGLASIVIYGGLILFGAFLLHDTQRVVKAAEFGGGPGYAHNYQFGGDHFDPINAQLQIYMDVLNIFIRIATILGMNQGNRKR